MGPKSNKAVQALVYQEVSRQLQEYFKELGNINKQHKERVSNLERQNRQLRAKLDSTNQLVVDQQALIPNNLQGILDWITKEISDHRGSVGQLQIRMHGLQQRIDAGGGIDCHSVHFASKQELCAWFNKHNLSNVLFHDAASILHAISCPVVHQDDATKGRDLQKKANMESTMETMVITSFNTVLPSILVSNKKEGSGGTFDWLKVHLKDYKVWDLPGRQKGLSAQILEGVAMIQKRTHGGAAGTNNR